jgi:flagellar hook-basal body complex protein FliE
MDTSGIDQLLGQMRASSAMAAGRPADAGGVANGPPGQVDFAAALKNAIDQVSDRSEGAQAMAREFSSGNENVNLHEVMIELQKASVSFQEMIQVRNKLVSAYQDVMNMQV